MRSVIRVSTIAFATVLLSLLAFAGQSVQAATLTVTTTADAGPGSFRQAIIDHNTNGAANTIVFNIPLIDPGYNGGTNRYTISLASELPTISVSPLTINNTTGRGVTVQGNDTFRILTLINGGVLTLNNLTIRRGGGGSTTANGLGGGIYMGDSAVLNLNISVVSDNTASNGGGGIWMNNSGTLHSNDSTISGNTTAAGSGGGIYINNSGTLNITRSTVSGNTATSGNGGGVLNGISGTITATNSTFHGNTAGALGVGGGIANFGGTAATLTANSSTFTGNTASQGGGIYNAFFTATLNNSLIALNTSPDGPDLKGTFSGSSNLVGNATGSAGLAPGTNQLGSAGSPINPMLGPLQDNGGPTFTRALLPGSPAIDAGATALPTDQRGVTRPKDGDGVGGALPDIGSFELDPTPLTPNTELVVIGSTGTVDDSDLTEYEVRDQFATIKDSVTGSVTYRYNLPAVGNFEDGTGPFTIRIRYRDTGTAQNVIVRLKSPTLGVDGIPIIYTFNSDSGSTGGGIAGANVNANQTFDECSVTLPAGQIVHGRYGYYLEVVISKTANDGTSSPGFIGFVISDGGISDVICP